MVLSDMQYGVLEFRLEIELESAELERVGMGRSVDRPCSDADSDAHAVGYTSIIGVSVVHELRKLRCPAKFTSQRWADTTKLLGVVASNGVEWWLASNGTRGH